MAYSSAKTHGKTARLEKNATAVDYIESWDLNVSVDMAEASRQGQNHKEVVAGQYGYSSSVAGHCVMGNTEQKALHDACLAGTNLDDMKWLINGSTEGWDAAGAYVNTMSISANRGDNVKINFGLQGNGALTLSDSQ